MEMKELKSVNDRLQKYDVFANADSDYIEVIEWANGEGWDININGDKHISLSMGELEAINYLTKVLEYGYSNTKNQE